MIGVVVILLGILMYKRSLSHFYVRLLGSWGFWHGMTVMCSSTGSRWDWWSWHCGVVCSRWYQGLLRWQCLILILSFQHGLSWKSLLTSELLKVWLVEVFIITGRFILHPNLDMFWLYTMVGRSVHDNGYITCNVVADRIHTDNMNSII